MSDFVLEIWYGYATIHQDVLFLNHVSPVDFNVNFTMRVDKSDKN